MTVVMSSTDGSRAYAASSGQAGHLRTSGKRLTPPRAAHASHSVWVMRIAVFALWTVAAATAQTLNFQPLSGSVSQLLSRVESDLAARNITACEGHACRTEGRQPRKKEAWFELGCYCDDACGFFGDCCHDAAGAGAAPRGDITCVPLRNYLGVYLVSRCPAKWPRDATRRRCEAESDLEADPLAGLPVTSPRSGLTYRNAACAQCHADTRDAVLWQAWVECSTVGKSSTAKLQRNGAGDWGVTRLENGAEVFHACTIDPHMPVTVTDFVRKCSPLVDRCPDSWTDLEVAELCGAYSARVYDVNLTDVSTRREEHTFRNPYCALCNGVTADDILCSPGVDSRILSNRNSFNTKSFSILLDIGDRSGSDAVGVVDVCRGTQQWDPFFLKCRDVLCDDGLRLEGDVCVPIESSRNTPIVFPNNDVVFPGDGNDGDEDGDGDAGEAEVSNFQRCPKFYLTPDEFEMNDDGTVYVELYDRRYGEDEFELRDGELVVCSVSSDFRKFDEALSIISQVFLAASIFCLCCHLVLFCLVSDLRNLSGKNLASLCVCLLLGYICFMAAPFQQAGSGGCRALGIIMYTAFIASFFWMNVMAFDVFITLRQATTELRVSSGRRRKRFLLYALYVCAMTGALVAAAVATDGSDDADNPYRPGFGDRVCWFSRRRALMAFFAAPLIVVMVANMALFVGSARIVSSTEQSTASMSCGPTKTNLRLYSRLAVITGLSWVVGLVAGWIDFPPLWYAFVVLNTLQGVFIFLSFTLADRVRSRIRREVSRYSHWQAGGRLSEDPLSDAGAPCTDSTGLQLTDCRP